MHTKDHSNEDMVDSAGLGGNLHPGLGTAGSDRQAKHQNLANPGGPFFDSQPVSSDLHSLSRSIGAGSPPLWPHFAPRLKWENWPIVDAPGAEASELKYNAEEISIYELIRQLYPQLDLIGLVRALAWLLDGPEWAARLEGKEGKARVLKRLTLAYGLRSLSDDLELIEALQALSPSVQDWISQKGFGARELAVLKLVELDDFTMEFLADLAKSNLSRAQCAQMIEWACELRAMGADPVSLQQAASKSSEGSKGSAVGKANREVPEDWHSRMRHLRFPRTLASDRDKKSLLTKVQIPPRIKIDWVRRGDHDGLALSIEAHTREELATRIRDLNTTVEKLVSEDGLWKS